MKQCDWSRTLVWSGWYIELGDCPLPIVLPGFRVDTSICRAGQHWGTLGTQAGPLLQEGPGAQWEMWSSAWLDPHHRGVTDLRMGSGWVWEPHGTGEKSDPKRITTSELEGRWGKSEDGEAFSGLV